MTLKTQKKNNLITDISTYRLSVQVTLNGLSFLVTLNKNTVTYYKHHNFTTRLDPSEILVALKKNLSTENELKKDFEEVTVLYATDLFTVVPKALFVEEKASEYLKFNSKILVNDFIAFDSLSQNELEIIYVPLVNINNYLFENFGNFTYYHPSTLYLNEILKSTETKVKIHVVVYSTHFECFINKGKKLLLANVYAYKTPEDFLYYILFNYEQLELDVNTIPLIISGNIIKDDSLHSLLTQYIKEVDFYLNNEILYFVGTKSHQEVGLKLSIQ